MFYSPPPLTTSRGGCTALTTAHFLNSFQSQVFPISFNTSLLLHQLQTDPKLLEVQVIDGEAQWNEFLMEE